MLFITDRFSLDAGRPHTGVDCLPRLGRRHAELDVLCDDVRLAGYVLPILILGRQSPAFFHRPVTVVEGVQSCPVIELSQGHHSCLRYDRRQLRVDDDIIRVFRHDEDEPLQCAKRVRCTTPARWPVQRTDRTTPRGLPTILANWNAFRRRWHC